MLEDYEPHEPREEDKRYVASRLEEAVIIWSHLPRGFVDPFGTAWHPTVYELTTAYARVLDHERVSGWYFERTGLIFGLGPKVKRVEMHAWIRIYVGREREPWNLDVFRIGDWKKKRPILNPPSEYYVAFERSVEQRMRREVEESDAFHDNVTYLGQAILRILQGKPLKL